MLFLTETILTDRYILYCDVRYDDFCIKPMFGSSLPPAVVGERMSYLCYLCLLGYSGIFVLLFVVLCTVPYVASFSGLSFLAHLTQRVM